ncbi:MAG: AAA family ATPase [Chloroflexi bacterium]|nr:AAA family ATPase [Chloroflexota bacterium]
MLFADIQGFTTLAESLDPEEVGDLLSRLWARLDAVVVEHGGRVDKHLGDSLMAVWGAPRAVEGDTERAVSCGLALQAALEALNRESFHEGETRLRLRVGINSGPALAIVIGSTGEYSLIGDMVNVAARLQSVAPPGGVAIGISTYWLVRDAFRFHPLPPQLLKGKTSPVEALLVVEREPYPARVRYRGASSLEVQLVGREAELARLRELLSHATITRRPHLALVTGEAGLGKSRLLFEFAGLLELSPRRPLVLSARALAENAAVPFSLWEALWANRLGLVALRRGEPASGRRERFLAGLREMWSETPELDEDSEIVHVLGHLVGLEWPDSPHLAPLRADPAALAARAADLAAVLLRRAGNWTAGVMVLDDLQHADRASLSVFEALLEQPDLRLLILGGSRLTPDRLLPGHAARETLLHLPLSPLPATEESVLAAFPRAANLPAAFRRRLAERAEGNPYFLEEMVKAMLQSGLIINGAGEWRLADSQAVEQIPLPDSLRAQLQARLDALGPAARAVALAASVVGRTFWSGIVEQLLRQTRVTSLLDAPRDADWQTLFDHAADELEQRELAFERVGSSLAGQREFIFKHALLQETAYSLLPHKHRRPYHALVARWLAQEVAGDHEVAVAEHYALAGEPQQAQQHYRRAAERLQQRGYLREAQAVMVIAAGLPQGA